MIQIYSIDHSKEWDEVVKTFTNYDVYYLSGYVKAFMIHGDGEPFLLHYDADGLHAIYVFMKRKTIIEGVYDSITPYGYGGVLFDGDTSEDNKKTFWTEYVAKMKELNIVDNFVRYHPVLANADNMRPVSDVIDLGKTITIDLISPDYIWENFTSKNRGKIRKAQKNGIAINHGRGMELFDQFIPIYNSTMDKDNANKYYYFDRCFYQSIHDFLYNNYELFYATLDGKIIMMAIMLFCNGQMHYHLSGTLVEYKSLAPNNLLLYEAALWGCEHGIRSLHLGGGVGSENDSLFEFKKGFNRQSDCQFSIGKEIFDQEMYDKMVEERLARDPEFDKDCRFFPAYRG